MRGLLTVGLSVGLSALAIAATSTDASARGLFQGRLGMSMVVLYSTSDSAGSSVSEPRDVEPGQMVMITGDCVKDSHDLNVVLSLADPEPQPRAGWHAMLVTDMEIEDGNLRVRVPDMVQARNHTFRVRLFVGSTEDACVCEAGSIRIT